MKQEKKINYWLDISHYDLKTAELMLQGKRFLYVGFMCHQAIEKIMKAFYVSVKGKNPPYTHNLSYLAQQCGIYEKLSEKFKDFIDILEPLNVEARYPTYKEKLFKTLDKKRCKEIIMETKRLHKWIEEKLLKE